MMTKNQQTINLTLLKGQLAEHVAGWVWVTQKRREEYFIRDPKVPQLTVPPTSGHQCRWLSPVYQELVHDWANLDIPPCSTAYNQVRDYTGDWNEWHKLKTDCLVMLEANSGVKPKFELICHTDGSNECRITFQRGGQTHDIHVREHLPELVVSCLALLYTSSSWHERGLKFL